jgi:hypothetical protein
VDSDRFFVVAVDPLGNGVSSSPSQGLQRFPPLTIEDQAQAQFLLVTRILGLEPTRTRFIWSQITGTSARWEQAYSLDAGKAWQTNWIMEFKRA